MILNYNIQKDILADVIETHIIQNGICNTISLISFVNQPLSFENLFGHDYRVSHSKMFPLFLHYWETLVSLQLNVSFQNSLSTFSLPIEEPNLIHLVSDLVNRFTTQGWSSLIAGSAVLNTRGSCSHCLRCSHYHTCGEDSPKAGNVSHLKVLLAIFQQIKRGSRGEAGAPSFPLPYVSALSTMLYGITHVIFLYVGYPYTNNHLESCTFYSL